MNRFKALAGRVGRIQRYQGDRLEIVEIAWPETELTARCELGLLRNGTLLFAFPKKLPTDEWVARYMPGPAAE